MPFHLYVHCRISRYFLYLICVSVPCTNTALHYCTMYNTVRSLTVATNFQMCPIFVALSTTYLSYLFYGIKATLPVGLTGSPFRLSKSPRGGGGLQRSDINFNIFRRQHAQSGILYAKVKHVCINLWKFILFTQSFVI